MRLSRPVLIYITLVVSLGIGIAAYILWRYPIGGDLTFWLLFAGFTLLAILGDRYGLHFARGEQIHVDTIPLFASVLVFNPAVALLIAALGRILGRIDQWLTGRLPLVEWLFNLGQTLVYVGVSALLLDAFTTVPWQPAGLVAWIGLLVSAVTMFLLNTSIVTGIVSLQSGASFLRLWLKSTPSGLLEHSVMFGFGLLTVVVVAPHPWGLALIALPSVAVFVTLQRTLRMEAQQTELAQENAALATDLSKQAEQLREAYTILEDALDAKNQMVQNVSHELRTPLVSISGYTEALEEGLYGDLSSDQLDALDIISRNTKTMIRLVNDLLSLQALDRSQLDLDEVSLSAMLHYCASSFAQRVEKTGISLLVEPELDLPAIRADQVRLEQVVCNLLDNAIKFSPDGGQVTLRAARLDDGKVQISVADQGIGIPEEELPRIYRRFYQVDSSRTRRFGGQGLGLAITKRIVELHGGNIRAESQVGKGTTFHVTLPRQITEAATPSADAEAGHSGEAFIPDISALADPSRLD